MKLYIWKALFFFSISFSFIASVFVIVYFFFQVSMARWPDGAMSTVYHSSQCPKSCSPVFETTFVRHTAGCEVTQGKAVEILLGDNVPNSRPGYRCSHIPSYLPIQRGVVCLLCVVPAHSVVIASASFLHFASESRWGCFRLPWQLCPQCSSSWSHSALESNDVCLSVNCKCCNKVLNFMIKKL